MLFSVQGLLFIVKGDEVKEYFLFNVFHLCFSLVTPGVSVEE